jgi:glycosyltransferase involved in cell wall biosynthesis
MMRLGVDAWNLPGDRRGIGRYLRALLGVWDASARERVEVTLIVPEWHTWTVRRRYRREVDERPYRVVSRAGHRRAGLDALWFPFNGCSWTSFSLPATATLHDASNFVVEDYAPQTQAIFRAAAQHCRALVTDSVFAQRELARELQIAPKRLVPIPLGVAAPRPERKVALDLAGLAPFVLYVGAAERRKGFDTLLDAMALVRRQRPELSLVVTTRLQGAFAVPPGVRIVELGYVDDDTLAALYRGCALLAFPSRYEGFGLPMLEAMSYGAPVIASTAASLPEAAGDAAAYVPPADAAALAAAILRVTADAAYARALRERGRARAAQFTWEAAAARTLDVIEGTLS